MSLYLMSPSLPQVDPLPSCVPHDGSALLLPFHHHVCDCPSCCQPQLPVCPQSQLHHPCTGGEARDPAAVWVRAVHQWQTHLLWRLHLLRPHSLPCPGILGCQRMWVKEGRDRFRKKIYHLSWLLTCIFSTLLFWPYNVPHLVISGYWGMWDEAIMGFDWKKMIDFMCHVRMEVDQISITEKNEFCTETINLGEEEGTYSA